MSAPMFEKIALIGNGAIAKLVTAFCAERAGAPG